MQKKEFLASILAQLDRTHMPVANLTITKKCWRDGFNKGKDNVIEQLEAILEQAEEEE